jgi:preprotein translocase subunit Sss1
MTIEILYFCLTMKILSAFILCIVVSSCSTIYKNGYYQSKKYNAKIIKGKWHNQSENYAKTKTGLNTRLEPVSVQNEKEIMQVYLVVENTQLLERKVSLASENATAHIQQKHTQTLDQIATTAAVNQVKKLESLNFVKSKKITPNEEEQQPMLALTAIGLFIFGFIFYAFSPTASIVFLVAALLMSFVSIKKYRKNKDDFENKWAFRIANILALVAINFLFILLLIEV